MIDEEHAPFDRVTIDMALLAARASQTAGIVRVAEPTPSKLLAVLDDAGIDTSKLSRRAFLRECNAVMVDETNGLAFLRAFFHALFARIGIDFRLVPALQEHHEAFFDSSQRRIERLQADGAEFIGDIATFRKVFENPNGITVATIHGVKGAEFDAVIAYALLEGMVPHFSDPDGDASANRLLYVICSRARRNLHLIAERGRVQPGNRGEYETTNVLDRCRFDYDVVE